MSRLSLSLLGPFALDFDGVPIRAFEANKVQALLAYLAVEQDHAHRREALGELLWPERPKEAAHNNLRKALFRLRQVIGDEDDSPPYLLTTQKTLQWNTASDQWVDVTEFESLIARTKTHQHEAIEQCETCINLLNQAVTLYRGDFLSDIYVEDSSEFEEWALTRREAVRRQVLDALDSLSTHYEERADYARAQDAARRRTTLDPLNEEAHCRLMMALALAGRRSEALAQYQACYDILAEELGVEPSAETIALYERIRSGELHQADRPRPAQPINVVPPAPPHNLPQQLTAFVGRELELEELVERLHTPTCRLITIIGLGGIGKSRLALAAAEQVIDHFPQGVWFVPLASISPNRSSDGSPDTLAAMIGQSLGFEFSAASEPTHQIIRYLRHQTLLLVLDNFENLLGTTGYLTEILQKAPHITILVTSRERLNLQAEYLMKLEGLPVPANSTTEAKSAASVQLFTERAEHLLRSGQDVDIELPYIIQICQLAQGIPLAIELAAAWVGHLTCAEIAEAIHKDLEILTTSMQDIPERQRSLRAVFEHSWGLLTKVEAAVLARLSVFRGGFTLDAAEHIASASLQVVASFQDKSLINREVSGRYEMHELLRQFAHEKLLQSGDLGTTEAEHFAYYLHLFEEAAPRIRTVERQATLKRLAADFDNFRAALQWSDGIPDRLNDNLRLASAADWWLWQHRGEFREGRNRMGKALDSANVHVTTNVRAHAIFAAAAIAYYQGDFGSAHSMFQEAVALYEASSDVAGVAQALGGLGLVLAMQSGLDEAVSTLKKSSELARQASDSWVLSMTLGNTGDALAAARNDEAARPYYTQAVRLARQVGDPWLMIFPLHGLASLMMRQNEYQTAHDLYEEALAIQQETGDKLGLARALWRLGDVALCSGEPALAKTRYSESLDVWRALGNSEHIIVLLGNLATVAQSQGEYETAARLLHECVSLRWEFWFDQGMARCMIGLAGMALFRNRAERAAYLLGAANRFSTQLDRYSSPADRLEYERVERDVRAHIDQGEFTIAWEKGTSITEEQALEAALGEAAGAWGLVKTDPGETTPTVQAL